MFQNKHFNPNYIRIRERWGRGLKVRTGVEGKEGFDFSMESIFWNNLFKGKNLLKQAKYIGPKIRIWHLGVLAMQKFINIALVILKIFKIVTPTTFPMKFDTKQTWYKWGQRKKWLCSSNKFLWLTFYNFLRSSKISVESLFTFA